MGSDEPNMLLTKTIVRFTLTQELGFLKTENFLLCYFEKYAETIGVFCLPP